MSDSPRWHLNGLPGTAGMVEVMLYADHVAVVAAARAEEALSREFFHAEGYAQGQRDERERIRTGVTGLPWEVAVSFGPIDCDYSCEEGPCGCSGVMRPEGWTTGLEDVLAVIDAGRRR